MGKFPAVDAIMEQALALMEAQGAVLIDGTNIETIEDFWKPEFEVLLYEFKHGLNAYLQARGPDTPVGSLEELIRFNQVHAERVMPYFGQEALLMSQEKGPLTETAYQEALAECRRLARTEGIDRLVADHRLDAIVAPSNAPAWLIDWIRGDHRSGGSSSTAAVAGYPVITVPAGYVHGLPVGISFFSTAYQEPVLLRLAYAFEQASQVRMPPQFLETVDFELRSTASGDDAERGDRK